MNRLPTKQIYLLTIIIVGIIALSVYSTYAIFTFESETSDIVSIHIPKSLRISENIYEYQQITLEPNTIVTTDIDIYNSYEHDICYSIWYKVVGENANENKVQVFQYNSEILTTSGVLAPLGNDRVTLAIINDNENQVKINLGTIGAEKEIDSCSLNLATDKNVISSTYSNLIKLTTELLNKKDNIQKKESNYLTYKDITETITLTSEDKMYISDKFNYNDELFTLEASEELTPEELIEKKYIGNKDVYYCKADTECQVLYKITEFKSTTTDDTTSEDPINYTITKYDKLIGYKESNNGLRQVNDKDYIYYGDNPNNYIYYNCKNNNDLTTCELWRIIGIFYNEETNEYNTKIIRSNSIGKYQYDYKIENNENISSNSWDKSKLHEYLNEEYKFINNYDMYLEEVKQELEIIPSLDTDVKNMKIIDQNINSKVNIVNLSDYLYASSCQKTKINEYTTECLRSNWLNNVEIEREWTLTSKEVEEIVEIEETTDETESTENNEEVVEENETIEEIKNNINYVYSVGLNIEENNVNDSLEIRPVVFLKSRMLLLEGNGTFENPYIVK